MSRDTPDPHARDFHPEQWGYCDGRRQPFPPHTPHYTPCDSPCNPDPAIPQVDTPQTS